MKIRINYSTLQGMTPLPDPSLEGEFESIPEAIKKAKELSNWDCDLALLLDAESDYLPIKTIAV